MGHVNGGNPVTNGVLALHERITYGFDVMAQVGRLAGHNNGTHTNSRAWGGMEVLYNYEEGVKPGTAKTIASSLTSKDGLSISAADAKNKATWESAGFDFDEIWTWDDSGDYMPSLHGEEIPWPDYLED